MAEKPFIPEFGPNGAVLNAPGVTPELREELVGGGARRNSSTAVRPFRVMAITAAIILAPRLVDLIGPNPQYVQSVQLVAAGFFAGVWVMLLSRRIRAWRVFVASTALGRVPPLGWRLAVDAVDFGLLATWAIAVCLAPSPAWGPLSLLMVVTLAIATLAAPSWLPSMMRSRGWALPTGG